MSKCTLTLEKNTCVNEFKHEIFDALSKSGAIRFYRLEGNLCDAIGHLSAEFKTNHFDLYDLSSGGYFLITRNTEEVSVIIKDK